MNQTFYYEYTKFTLNRRINRLLKLYKIRKISKKVKNDVEKYILENSIFGEYIENYRDMYGPGVYKSVGKNIENPEYFYCGLELINNIQFEQIQKINNLGIICNASLKIFKEKIKEIYIYEKTSFIIDKIFKYFSNKQNKKYVVKMIKIVKKYSNNIQIRTYYLDKINDKINKIFVLLTTEKLLIECCKIKKLLIKK